MRERGPLHRSTVVRRAVLLALLCLPVAAQEQVVVDWGTPLTYLANPSDPGFGLAWIEPGFDDGAWTTGVYGIGFGTGGLEQTLVSTGATSIYTRAVFNVTDAAQITNVFAAADYDDGYIIYLNGTEVFRSPEMPSGDPTWDTQAADHESSNGPLPVFRPQSDISGAAIPALVDGENVLAIGVWDAGGASADLVVAPQVTLNKETKVERGPYLQLGRPDGVTIRWRSSVPMVSRVEYGTVQGNPTQSVEGSEARHEHAVELNGLQPGTTYYYAVGGPGEMLAGGDAEHFFVTAPAIGSRVPTRIWVLGDSGTANPNAEAVRDAYYAYSGTDHTDLWLMLGDNAYPNGTDRQYQAALFDMFPEMLRKSVLYPTRGNHDLDLSYYDIFTMPSAGEAGGLASGTESYYSFDHANVHFVVLNSQTESRQPGSSMLTWLDQDLASTLQDWTIVYWHHPPYSRGSHDSDAETQLIEMRENVVSILDARGVDLTLTGHSHSYERSYFIDGHYGLSDTFVEVMKVQTGDGLATPYSKPNLGTDPHRGIVHTVAGSGGQTSGGTFDHPAILVSRNLLGSLVIDVDGSQLDLRFLTSSGIVEDHFKMTKGQPPEADFGLSTIIGAVPLTVDFSDLSLHVPTSWAWDFENDGLVDSQTPNPIHEFTERGIYSVRLWVANIHGSDEELKAERICVHGAVPEKVAGLSIEGDKTALTWAPQPDAADYDIVRGDLMLLRATGDYRQSDPACLDEAGRAPSTIDPLTPSSDQAFYYLVRATDCGNQVGSFDTDGTGQLGSRDPDLFPTAEFCTCPPGLDADGDAVCDTVDDCTDLDDDGFGDPGFGGICLTDNCPAIPNPTQDDSDLDGNGDVCDVCPFDPGDDLDFDGYCGNVDNCPVIPNPLQIDTDLDGMGDACDPCIDSDGDGAGDPGFPINICPLDNCPTTPNPQQEDRDADGLGDACDSCPEDPGNDADNDGVCGEVDNCPVHNPAQLDADGDGLGDACDDCTDLDLDGFGSPGFPANTCTEDNCPDTFNPLQGDTDADGPGDLCDSCTDTDGDGAGDPGFPGNTCPQDNCPAKANPAQIDSDSDGLGDACDSCPGDSANDSDGDGVCGNLDNCPSHPNPDQNDLDGDGSGDICDLCTDSDGDGLGDPGFSNNCPDDNCPTDVNPGQQNVDGDLFGDACDVCPEDPLNDADADLVCGDVDNCPEAFNPGQGDADLDGRGDVCDDCTDTDGDGFGNAGFPGNCQVDNCPDVANPGQGDADGDSIGNECDNCTDTDGDGFGDPGFPANVCPTDNCRNIFNPDQLDTDQDGVGDACEP